MSGGFSILAVAKKGYDLAHPTRRGLFFIKNRRGNGGIGRVFKNGAGYSGILAGYLNYWRPNLPKFVIRRLSNSVKIYFEYHRVFRAVKYMADSTTGD